MEEVRKELKLHATPGKAKASSWFFKTGEGQYGYGDKFLGVTVPEQRAIAKKFRDLKLEEIQKLLASEFHEERLTALFILVLQFQKADEKKRIELYDFYLKNIKCVNNWDLVDSSAPYIIGMTLLNSSNRSILEKLARSVNIWERRIAMISTFTFIRNKEYEDAFKIADALIEDKTDLIQKAVGWMLREAGKNCGEEVLDTYLKPRCKKLGRTALRYAIERMDKEKRAMYLAGTII